MNNKTIAKQRNPAIELYRVLLMFLIVLHHAAYHGHWNHTQGLDAAYPSAYWLFTALTIWHVDGFISITGWFGTHFSLVRIAKIWGVIAFYTLLSIVYGFMTMHCFKSCFIAGGWFGKTYLFFLFLVPILNAGISQLQQRGNKSIMYALGVFDVAVALNWFRPYTDITGVVACGGDPFSLLTFITLYLNVRAIKLSGIYEKITKRIVLCSVVVFVAASVAFKVLINYDSWYNAPHVILMAIMSLVFFDKFISVPRMLGKMCMILSPLTFGIYILHDTTTFGHFMYQIPQEWLAKNSSLHPLLIIFASAVFCFLLGAVVETLRKVLFTKISSYPLSIIEKIEVSSRLRGVLP